MQHPDYCASGAWPDTLIAMVRRLHHRWRVTLRTGMLLVFAFGLVAQPVLDGWREVHEHTAHADSARGHDLHGLLPHEHTSTPPSDERDTGGPVHTLLHNYAHCCGHAVGLAAMELPLPCFHGPEAAPGDAVIRPAAASHTATPFRPPISA